jgi:hypothetical protein
VLPPKTQSGEPGGSPLASSVGRAATPKALLVAAHRKSGVNTVVSSKFSARWSHTKSSVHYDYNSLLLPSIAECNWKF